MEVSPTSISGETLRILAFLIPGFISSAVLNAVVTRSEKNRFSKLIEALIFSFLTYAVVAATGGVIPDLLELGDNDIRQWTGMMTVLGLSLVWPLAIGFLVRTDLHMRALRSMCVTNKTSRESIWLDTFTDLNRYVIVNLRNGKRLFGYPDHFSDTPEGGMLCLWRPHWVDKDGGYTALDGTDHILIVGEEISSVEFTAVPTTKEEVDERQGT